MSSIKVGGENPLSSASGSPCEEETKEIFLKKIDELKTSLDYESLLKSINDDKQFVLVSGPTNDHRANFLRKRIGNGENASQKDVVQYLKYVRRDKANCERKLKEELKYLEDFKDDEELSRSTAENISMIKENIVHYMNEISFK